jgi:hypothetical protein
MVVLAGRGTFCRQERYKPKTIEVDRNPPIGAAGLKLEAGIIIHAQAITAFPSAIPAVTCSQIISRTLREYVPT